MGCERPCLQPRGCNQSLAGDFGLLELGRDVAGVVLHPGEVSAGPALESQVADCLALRDGLAEQGTSGREAARAMGLDEAEVHLCVGDGLLRSDALAKFEAPRAMLVRAFDLAELGKAPSDGRTFERNVAGVAGDFEGSDGCFQMPQERGHVADVRRTYALHVMHLRARERVQIDAGAGELGDAQECGVGFRELPAENQLEGTAAKADQSCGGCSGLGARGKHVREELVEACEVPRTSAGHDVAADGAEPACRAFLQRADCGVPVLFGALVFTLPISGLRLQRAQTAELFSARSSTNRSFCAREHGG
jgi:hypothetical protein